jgi:protein O-GlcNAc transferase
VTLPASLREARRQIAQHQPDILFYTDIGMEPVSYSLGFSRLAAVQCVTWGHPITTGIDTIDYFISSELLDGQDAQKHYTEKLVRLPSLAVYYYRPTLTEPHKTRADFDLPGDANLYGCLQAMWKYHPEFDALLAEILRRDPRARLLALGGNSDLWRDRLRTRLARSMGSDVERIIFMPGQKHADFLALTAACDVMLDPIHFGGGNTGYEAFAFRVPVVTWPSEFLRGRIALAQYKAMGIDDCIASSAQEYIDIAVQLGTDATAREAMRARILEANAVLYENVSGVRELEEFFKQALAKT